MNRLKDEIIKAANASAARPFIAAVDGRCGAGKSTLAAMLEREGWTVFHMDDFFLQPHQRTQKRLGSPGGNTDRERFAREVLLPLRAGEEVITYCPFDCRTMSLSEPVTVRPGRFCAVEGSYCCHPELRDSYDLRVFLTVDSAEQINRITRRCSDSGGSVQDFRDRWIPLEERYFAAFGIEEKADICWRS